MCLTISILCNPLENCISLHNTLDGELRWITEETNISIQLSLSCAKHHIVAIGLMNTTNELAQFVILKIPTEPSDELLYYHYEGYVDNQSLIELSRSANPSLQVESVQEGNKYKISLSSPQQFSRGVIILPSENDIAFNEEIVIRNFVTVLDTDFTSQEHKCEGKSFNAHRIRTLTLVISMTFICIMALAAFAVVLWKSRPVFKKEKLVISNSEIPAFSV